MQNEGTLEVALLDVAGAEAKDPHTKLTIRRGTTQHTIRAFKTSFPPGRQFTLPAFPTESVLTPFIEPQRFRGKPLPSFTLTHGKTVVRNVTVFRDPSNGIMRLRDGRTWTVPSTG